MGVTLQNLIDAAQSASDGTAAKDAVAVLLAENASSPDVDVVALATEAVAAFNDLHSAGADSDDALAAVEALADVIDGVAIEQARLDQSAQEHRDRLDTLAERVKAATGAEDAADGEGGDAATSDADATGATGEADTGSDADTTADTGAVDVGAADASAAPVEAVAASANRPVRRVRLADLPRKEVVTTQTAPRLSITAAADVAGFATGQRLASTTELARAANARMGAFATGVEGIVQRAGIAQIRIPFQDDLVADGTRDQEVIDHAADAGRLEGGSLVAAGGWCAPSETLYELGGILADANVGLIDVPEVQAKRGGLRFTEGPDYTAIYNATGFMQTEAQAIAGDGFTKPTGETVAGTEKPFYRVPCPEFAEKRAETAGLGIVAGILQNDAYPEVTAEVVEHALIAHSHKVNARTIKRMVDESGTAISLSLGASASTSVLNALDIQIVDYRYLNRAPESLTLEVKAPMWLKAVFRADLAQRSGLTPDEGYKISDQQIDSWFAARNAKPQWVYDWQDAFTGVASGFGGATAITSWPDTVDLLIYAAGTFVRARGEVINLEGIYDSTNLEVNDFHRLFVEEKLLVIKRRWKARLLRVPLALNGATGIARELDGDGKIVPVTP
ncbi:hypothetical protein DEU38_103183 [Rhodococcus sp. AG1013]|uniref:major capsid protein n=1 Tax=Rhodococcus sp. AG1013 TaxID=2183996 RepID=UPI000E0B85FE|nr:major capsid protein [Rhodococcus sp. AG1013]RDI32450.1 hypothetical protein DEU38_103183 [Rhodococcus sp. AG1013]